MRSRPFPLGLAVGLFKSPDDVRRVWREDRTFQPKLDVGKRAAKLERWRRAVAKA